ncbi:MAG TPA: AMP-binding protein [Acidimicrobiales bacterium]|jgi:acyl-CoA synthetase (AMP-forming)/AMP-acid ligase II|nr:AMP-binding protein [Acidimicrobiales bacterium]
MTTIAELVERASRRFASRVAVVDGERQATFTDVGERSARLANALLGLSPRDGSRVGVLMANRLEFVEVDFAIARAGKVKAPINPRLTDDERSFILANCGAEILVTDRGEFDRAQAMRTDLPELRHVINVDDESYRALLSAASPSRPDMVVDPDQPSMILHTSGTTGRPKGATTSQRARVAATAAMLLDEFDARRHDGMVHVAPMSHGSGSKILAYFVRGARNVTLAKFAPATFFAAMRASGGTSTFVVPTMIRMLLDDPGCTPEAVACIRNLTYGGAPMPVALAEEAIDVFGPVLTQVYGSCEAPHPVTVLSREDHAAGGGHLGSAGYPTSGVELRVVGPDGDDVAPGEPGELWIRGENVMSGYWGDPAATAQALRDGWYRSGDVVRIAETGLVTIVGREREMLISGGLNVYPAEVEAVLHRHDGISEAAVFGIPDDVWGEVVAAAVVTRKGRDASEEDILRHCMDSLAGYKLPRRIIFVDALPKGSTGKVSRSELVALQAQGGGS